MKRLTVPATLESLAAIRQSAQTVAAMASLDRKRANRLVVAVDEVASNIIVHGYDAAGREGMVELLAAVDEHVLTISIEDTGIAYDPGLPASDDVDLPLEKRELGGWGLLLARRNVDEFRYERVHERNRHTLMVYQDTA